VRYLLPAESVSVFYLRFPDPWPKRRHHRRRIVNEEFLSAILRSLAPGGLLRIATDQEDYFREIEEATERESRFRPAPEVNGDVPETTFERRFLAAGQPIYRLDLRKTSPDK
jgi:tRNA (guanine-N7-)-methyltransferase